MTTPLYDDSVAIYKYFTADLLSNEIISEIPFKGVSYERSIKAAGAFSGKIPAIEATSAFNLYETTMPGKTALYVVRNDVCVWGGIIWKRSYNAKEREISVSGSEFTSYFYKRNIWKTFSHDFEATIIVSSGLAQVTLETGSYELPVGSSVRIIFYEVGNFQYNGYYTVLASPVPTSEVFYVSMPTVPDGTYTLNTVYIRTDSYDYMRQLLDSTLVDFTNIDFPNDEIEPASVQRFTIVSKEIINDVATLETSTAHNLIVGQTAKIENVDAVFDGEYQVTGIPTPTSFTCEIDAPDVPQTAISNVTLSVTNRFYFDGVATLTTSGSHGLSIGDVIQVSGVDSTTAFEISFDGIYTVIATPAANQVSYETFAVNTIASSPSGGTILLQRAVVSATYGPFPANSDINLFYSDEGFSGNNIENRRYRGYELRSVGEELDEYSDTIDGFEYRIDCDYDPVSGTFTKTLVFIPIDFPDPPAPGEVSPISRFGADKLVFEFPGNIIDISIDESAENAATRFFTVGNIPDLGDDASQPYAVASAVDLLNSGWPLLDQEETISDISDESALYDYAQRYLGEFRPPVVDLTVNVNGSLQPVLGTYAPGDWCSIIAEDEFIKMRLSSDLEVRDTVLVRKIDSFSVQVPDTPSFPEQVTLQLITEWEVDKRG